jgi:hypothetical protein
MSMGVNHLGHFLLVNLLLDDMSRAKNARLCIVGSITGNTNTVGGGLVYPQADLGTLKGFEKGAKKPISMADSKPFFGAKAYKDSKVCGRVIVVLLLLLFGAFVSLEPFFSPGHEHDDGLRTPPSLPRLYRHCIFFHVPRMHCRDCSVP